MQRHRAQRRKNRVRVTGQHPIAAAAEPSGAEAAVVRAPEHDPTAWPLRGAAAAPERWLTESLPDGTLRLTESREWRFGKFRGNAAWALLVGGLFVVLPLVAPFCAALLQWLFHARADEVVWESYTLSALIWLGAIGYLMRGNLVAAMAPI